VKSLNLSAGQLGILLLTFLALALGGATQLWEQGIIVLLAAGLLLVFPPQRSLGFLPNFLFPILLLVALAAFLPAGWTTAPWREHLTADLHLSLPQTRTPQPWLTAQACCLFFVGSVWAYFVLSQRWHTDMRLRAAQLLVAGVALLAALAVAAFALNFHVPDWNQEENRGWFPNRNQTADVLALCGVLNYAMIFDCLRKKSSLLYVWLCSLALIAAALVVSYSRAGILMFFGGILLWHLWPVAGGKKGSSIKWVSLSLALAFILLTLFFLFGGDTLERFEGPSLGARDTQFRWAIQKDAFHFSLQSPLFGVGLGNFEPLFASARQASVNADRTIHPESDWLWAACELGWLAPLIFVGGIIWWLRRCLPFGTKSGESLRRALTVAGILFILHGFVDVSGHRLGSLCVGLLVFSLALPAPERVPPWRGGALFFRGLAVLMLAVAVWWLTSAAGAAVPPTTASLERLEGEIDQALAAGQVQKMEALSTEALKIAPLNWHLYFQRAYAETFQAGETARAGADFMAARLLESKWVKPCFDEGSTWLVADEPDLCMDAWQEALRRATPEEKPDLYKEMLALARNNEMVHDDLLELAAGNLAFQLIFLDFASTDETNSMVADILKDDPDLHSVNQHGRETLFTAWWNQGDRDALVTNLKSHADWLDAGWFFLARACANEKDFQQAWEIVAKYSPAPIIPAISSDRPVAELEQTFYDQNENLADGILLYLAQAKQGRVDDALSTLRALEKNKDCPKYVYYLEAKLWAQKQQWELAWTAWQNGRQT
jgi:O-antigen ligase